MWGGPELLVEGCSAVLAGPELGLVCTGASGFLPPCASSGHRSDQSVSAN